MAKDGTFKVLSASVDKRGEAVVLQVLITEPNGQQRHCTSRIDAVHGVENGQAFVMFSERQAGRKCSPEYK